MRYVVAVLALFLPLSAFAYDFSGNEIFIPIASRVAGANNTEWRTDLVVTNRSTTTATEVSLWFFADSSEGVQHRFTLEPLETVTFRDFLFTEWNFRQHAGTIWMGAKDKSVKLAAHARIYNAGNPAGEFGQIVHGLPPEKLSKVLWMSGLTGINGNRTNIGIANPANTTALFSISWYDRTGSQRGSVHLGVDPWDVLIINDIFTSIGLPPDEGLTLKIRSSNNPLYAYASVVRNDTGDAYTIIASGSED